MNQKTKIPKRNPEVDRVTPELETLLSQFSDGEIETGVVSSARNTLQSQHTVGDLVQRLNTAILERSISQILKQARTSCNMSLADVSELLCVSRTRAHQIEQDGANLQLDTLRRTADALGYDVQITFLPRDEDKPALTTPVK